MLKLPDGRDRSLQEAPGQHPSQGLRHSIAVAAALVFQWNAGKERQKLCLQVLNRYVH